MKKSFLFLIMFIIVGTSVFYYTPTNKVYAATCRAKAKIDPAGKQADNYYLPNKQFVKINIETENCIGQTITVDLKEADTCGVANCDDSIMVTKNGDRVYLEDIPIKVEQKDITIELQAGEEGCEAGPGYDCNYYVRVEQNSGSDLLYSSWDEAYGELLYECDAVCLDNWIFKGITYSGGTGTVDANGNSVSIQATGNKVFDEDYKLLAPLPGVDKIDNQNDTLGTYLNFFFKFAIAICAGLAVLMIVIYGVQYMGDESVFGHTEAKSKIWAAITGLLLALGAYAILNTINPDLVGSNGIKINQVKITLDEKNQIEIAKVNNPGGLNSYVMQGTFDNPKGSVDGISTNTLSSYLKSNRAKLNEFRVYTGGKRGCFFFYDSVDKKQYSLCVPINIGRDGTAEQGQALSGDWKTPKGTHTVSGTIILPTNQNTPAKTPSGVNLGAAFLGLSINGKDASRGIGIHGDARNCIINCNAYSYTQGCIKMSNDDLVLLAPYIVRDKIPIVVQ